MQIYTKLKQDAGSQGEESLLSSLESLEPVKANVYIELLAGIF